MTESWWLCKRGRNQKRHVLLFLATWCPMLPWDSAGKKTITRFELWNLQTCEINKALFQKTQPPCSIVLIATENELVCLVCSSQELPILMLSYAQPYHLYSSPILEMKLRLGELSSLPKATCHQDWSSGRLAPYSRLLVTWTTLQRLKF
jgi:hypothetical protein